jgi:hypothetical protein
LFLYFYFGGIMTRRNRQVTPEQVAKWIAEGRGQGRKLEYKGWYNIQDIASEGNVHREKGLIIPRVYHFASGKELHYFHGLELAHLVPNAAIIVDIREQFPLLPQQETLDIAKAHGIKPPTDPKTQHPTVMTTDFVITIRVGHDFIDIARTIKPSEKIDKRVLEKFEIERIYWEERGISWGIVTERDMPEAFIKNAAELRKFVVLDQHSIASNDIITISEALTDQIYVSSQPLNKLCLEMDHLLGFKPSTSLLIAKHLIATGQWTINLFEPFVTTERITLL